MAQAGLDPVAGYTPAHETSQRDTALAREYPLALVTPANHYFLNSIFANVPRQQRRAGAATLVIHPDDAAPRHIAAGDEVRVANARARSSRSPTSAIASAPAWWPAPRDGGRAARRRGATVNATVDERDSDMGGGAVFHDNRVRVDRSA